MLPANHFEEGADPGPYNSNPPTSGPHYASSMPAGFYDETSPETDRPYPEGYLVHRLEHGYVIFWYNCTALTSGSCDELKDEIHDLMHEFDDYKVIGFPRASLNVPVVATFWGRKLRMESFDVDLARAFVKANRNKAPEPDAQ